MWCFGVTVQVCYGGLEIMAKYLNHLLQTESEESSRPSNPYLLHNHFCSDNKR